MIILDVTLPIHEGMPVWPGDDPVVLRRRTKIEEGAHANVSFMSMSAHTGTHVDAPYHFIADGSKIHEMPLEVLLGPVQVVEVPESAVVINAEWILSLGLKNGIERVIFKTRNSNYWALEKEEFQTQFIGIDQSGAEELARREVKLVGIDYLSVAPYKASKPTHDVMLGAKMVVIEGLDLRNVAPGIYILHCLPMKLFNADGAPARVVLTQD